ncbi:class I SAM-dependent methyltransferase [Iningainema tapete]|uniref:Class I SAM-dependent methyltransferase n=1 Tax=Iningainema tapete BLCC-T55 TaxID=2748662 RepID=A0A8J6XG05_9CYAN|nr:class I SAM-dependent methyltransferase [Iningainema tapete]MBD2770929.1 class I SAM-dependent methyltransferase [Iningainema tapete BLCC-T55]
MSKLDFEKHFLTGIDEYILRVRQSIPGRDALFLIARCCLENKLSAYAKILVIGAGGGEEIISLGKHNAGWQFVGVDLSEEMLKLAESRIKKEGLVNEVQLYKMEVIDLENKNFDAATCILTLHFIPDDGAKLATLQAIRERLKPNAPFVLVDGAASRNKAEFNDNVMAWKRHAQNNGMTVELLDSMIEKAMGLPFVTEEREVELLTEAGFSRIRKIYQGTWFNGWLSVCEKS